MIDPRVASGTHAAEHEHTHAWLDAYGHLSLRDRLIESGEVVPADLAEPHDDEDEE